MSYPSPSDTAGVSGGFEMDRVVKEANACIDMCHGGEHFIKQFIILKCCFNSKSYLITVLY